jgi:hypothetical protein
LGGAQQPQLDLLRQQRGDAWNVKERIAHRLVEQAVAADFVAGAGDAPGYLGMFACCVAGEEKGRRYAVSSQDIQDHRCPMHQPLVVGRKAADVRLHVEAQDCLHRHPCTVSLIVTFA